MRKICSIQQGEKDNCWSEQSKNIDCSGFFLATRYIWGIFNISVGDNMGLFIKSDLQLNRSSVNLSLLRGHLQWEQIRSHKKYS